MANWCAECVLRRPVCVGTAVPATVTPSPPKSPPESPCWPKVCSPNPQLFALGVKEVWETKRPLDRVIHTLGWPLPTDAFGGSFMYPLGPGMIAVGMVVGLD